MQPNDTPPRRAPKQSAVTISCDECGRAFSLVPSRIRLYKHHFCSEPCRDMFTGRNRRVDPSERFWANVSKNGPLPASHPEYGVCWPRSGANCRGYGIFNNGVIKSAKTTHFAWEAASGVALPPGTVLGHTCDNPPCVRNDDVGTYEVDGLTYERRGHLWLAGDTHPNMRDMKVKGRAARVGGPMIGLRGEASLNAKLTDADVRTIRALASTGDMRQIDIARQFGIGQSSVSRLLLRKAWTHIE